MTRRRWRKPAAAVGLALVPAVFVACSTAGGKRWVEVLFDDPPSRRQAQPAPAPIEVPAPRTRAVPLRPKWQGSTHGPFAAQLCAACHTVDPSGGRVSMSSGSLLLQPRRELCPACHGPSLLGESARRQHTALHGPVAAGLCLACHDPHRTRQPFLLRVPPEEVCSRCHEAASLQAAHPPPDEPCMECHDPHAAAY